MKKGKIMFLIRELSIGGAERQLIVLARGLMAMGWDVVIATFYDRGELESMTGGEIPLRSLRKSGRWDLLSFVQSFRALIRSEAPDILYSHLDGPNVVAAAARSMRFAPPVVWALGASNIKWSDYDLSRRATFEMTRVLSRVPEVIIVNSEAGRVFHVEQGYPVDRVLLIPNGIDTDLFAPDAAARERVRSGWGVGPDTRVVGIVGRLDPMKGHMAFLRAAQRIAADIGDVKFVVIGSGDAEYGKSLHAFARELGIYERILWLKASSEIPAILNAFDALVLASEWGEGLPNVLAEAMACGVPCVATDVGDTKPLLEGQSQTVPIGDSEGLARECVAMLRLSPEARAAWGKRARQSIIDRYSVDRLVTSTSAAVDRALASARSK